jgi:hypothetical protein
LCDGLYGCFTILRVLGEEWFYVCMLSLMAARVALRSITMLGGELS